MRHLTPSQYALLNAMDCGHELQNYTLLRGGAALHKGGRHATVNRRTVESLVRRGMICVDGPVNMGVQRYRLS